ncbi:PrgI family protein [Allofournierella massiliensis]|uniref:AAA domain-containing protein n=1 Tax=Allofournierella massiliensis TaxID=1650663 RepID=A0A4R1QN23_9FIRM|nr:PrgI family protein [Fournierella massiliensis]TCL54363.1 AAA domain-containing protein [Fournierella massiliensis]
MSNKNDHDIYIIPPNFIETGTFFGGMFRARNVIEAGVLAFAIGAPVFVFLPFGLTTRIIALCLTALPVALVALIGISGESLSQFLVTFLKYLRNRRVVGGDSQQHSEKAAGSKPAGRHLKQRPPREKTPRTPKHRRTRETDFPAEFDEVRSYEIREKLRPKKSSKKKPSVKKTDKKAKKAHRKEHPPKRPARIREEKPACINPVADYLPIEKIANGIIYTKDHRFVKVVEVVPINFMLRSAREQRNIIYSFVSYLKISPIKLQIKVLTRRADIDRHLDTVRREMAQEENEQCRLMQEDYLNFVQQVGSHEAVTRRFFLIFEYEPWNNTRRSEQEDEAIQSLQNAVHTASNYLRQCGNEVIVPENEDEFTVDVLYNLLCRNESAVKPLSVRAQEVVSQYRAKGREDEIDRIPAAEFAAPQSIDFTHGRYICVDGLYYAYLLVPSDGYKTQVSAGWLSLIVNAGDGIDLDMFLSRQPKERIIQRVGQQLRINRSKIKDASDTNTDFDDIDGAIRSGYFLKEGLANNEDFYYLNLLITVTAPSVEDLEWKVSEMKKLLLSQDMDVCTCHFREEQAFCSALPLVSLEKGLFERGKRNLLTGGAASCYPFTSFEMCDDNGILLGVNKYNSSLIIVDIFNSAIYKNANMAILGTSGAGKTFTMQLMALRMRRKNIPIFIVAPLKGHEFHRACANVGGEFIQISPASPHCINVMEIRRVDRSVSELLDGPGIQLSELAAKIQQLHIFFSLLIPDMSHEERQLLDEALIRTYNAKGITHDNASLEDPSNPGQYREMPVLGDLHEILKASPETTRMAHILNRLVHGSASTFNKQTNVRLDNKYTVLDISSLTGDLLTVGMFVALDFVWDRAKADRTEEKAIFIDECWQLLSGAGATGTRLAGDFILEIFKTIRGYGGSAICASQDLNDFFNLDEGRFGKGIINNSKTKIILNLEDDEAERVQDTLHLSDAETMEVTHFERGNGLISTNNNNIMVEFKASPLEKDLITTDRRELREILERKRQEQSASA